MDIAAEFLFYGKFYCIRRCEAFVRRKLFYFSLPGQSAINRMNEAEQQDIMLLLIKIKYIQTKHHRLHNRVGRFLCVIYLYLYREKSRTDHVHLFTYVIGTPHWGVNLVLSFSGKFSPGCTCTLILLNRIYLVEITVLHYKTNLGH